MILIYGEIGLILILGFIIWKYRSPLSFIISRTSQQLFMYVKHKDRGRSHQFLYRSGKRAQDADRWLSIQWTLCKWIVIVVLVVAFVTGQLFWLILPFLYISVLYLMIGKNVQKRKELILKRIPFVMDMLILNMESGLDLISALEELAKMDTSHPLQQEVKLTLQNIHLGELRATAFENLSERTQISELKGLAMAVSQSESMGTSLTDLLRIQAQEIRHRIFKMAEAQAQKAPVKILLPMIGFIFPVVFILLFVPIGLQMMKMF